MACRSLLVVLLVSCAVAGCGGGGSPAPSAPGSPPAAAQQAPVIGGLQRAIDAAHGAVATSQQDAARASATSAGP